MLTVAGYRASMNIDGQGAAAHFFPRVNFTQVYLEAVANALDAEASTVAIEVILPSASKTSEVRLRISDNGRGMDADDYTRFATVLKPKDAHHKGVGKLVYLSYFGQVQVESQDASQRRSFRFHADFAPTDSEPETAEPDEAHPRGLSLRFDGFGRKKLADKKHIQPQFIKQLILDEFLPELSRRKRASIPFEISIRLSMDDASGADAELFPTSVELSPRDLPDFESVEVEAPQLFGGIRMLHSVVDGQDQKRVWTAASVDNRSIDLKLLDEKQLPDGVSAIFLFESDAFEAESSRQRLLPKEDPREERRLIDTLRKAAGRVLAQRFPEIREMNRTTLDGLRGHYPHLEGYFPTAESTVLDREASLKEARDGFFKDQREVLEAESLSEVDYEKALEVSSRTLAEYVLHRSVMIKKVKETTRKEPESFIHDTFVPQRTTLHGEDWAKDAFRNNAWLLDDKFISYSVTLSEQKMTDLFKVIAPGEEGVVDDGRPDIAMVFSGDPAAGDPVDVVVIELKRKTESLKDNSFVVTQLLQRARLLVRHRPTIQRVWYYGIVEISEEFRDILEIQEWTKLYSKGDVFYKEHTIKRKDDTAVPCPLILCSFEALIQDATERNEAFLRILRTSFQKPEAGQAPADRP